MKMVARIVLLILLILPPAASMAQEKATVGYIFGETAQTTEGVFLDLMGVRLAVEKLNRGGGILGKQIDLVELYNNNTPLGSRQAAEAAVASGVMAVIGPASSSHGILAGEVLQRAGIPMVSAFSTHSDLTLLGNYIFRISFSNNFQGQALANFAINDLKAKTAVVLTCMDEKYSLNLAAFFKKYYVENGGSILWEGGYLDDSTDFRELLEKALSYRPAFLFLPGYNRASGFIIRQCRKMGEDVTFLGGDGLSYNLYEFGGDALEGCYYSGHWYPDPENEASRDFAHQYENSFKREDLASLALTRDAVFLLADAVERAGSFQPSLIRDALAATQNFQGVTGTITMDRNGDPVKPVFIFKLEGGSSVLVKTVRP